MNKKELRTYRIWKAMKSRCYSPSKGKHGYYQKDNITVCDEWKNSYEKFMEDMGEPNMPDCSIERIDNSKGYCPENCKWISVNEQSKNRRCLRLFTYNGQTKCLKDWAREIGMNYSKLYARIYRFGLPFELAIQDDAYNRLVEINGKKKTVTEWCKIYGTDPVLAFDRIHKGWDRVSAITKPKKVNKI